MKATAGIKTHEVVTFRRRVGGMEEDRPDDLGSHGVCSLLNGLNTDTPFEAAMHDKQRGFQATYTVGFGDCQDPKECHPDKTICQEWRNGVTAERGGVTETPAVFLKVVDKPLKFINVGIGRSSVKDAFKLSNHR